MATAEKYITFVEQETFKKKTKVWSVITRRTEKVGEVRWWGGFRKYCFFPERNTLFDPSCLRMIADWCEKHNKERTRN